MSEDESGFVREGQVYHGARDFNVGPEDVELVVTRERCRCMDDDVDALHRFIDVSAIANVAFVNDHLVASKSTRSSEATLCRRASR